MSSLEYAALDAHHQIPKPDLPAEKRNTLISRNITILGRRTSVRLEVEMWSALKDIARREGCTMHEVCSLIFLRKKEKMSLTSAIRVFLLLYYRAAATENGHQRAGHGSFERMRARAGISRHTDGVPAARTSPTA